ncbi:hypothetical protein [Martelella mangrovi]|uniref:Uncharacterized protein n=1 Tax=Martelella mangrovi TaxID=1397477 RepID=A0ABV2IGD0_9HYPH
MSDGAAYEADLKTSYRAVRDRLMKPVQAAPEANRIREEKTMGHSLGDLNEHLFSQLDRLSDQEKTPEKLEVEVKRAEAVVSVASQIISNADTAIKAAHLVVNHGDRFLKMVPMLEGKKQ